MTRLSFYSQIATQTFLFIRCPLTVSFIIRKKVEEHKTSISVACVQVCEAYDDWWAIYELVYNCNVARITNYVDYVSF